MRRLSSVIAASSSGFSRLLSRGCFFLHREHSTKNDEPHAEPRTHQCSLHKCQDDKIVKRRVSQCMNGIARHPEATVVNGWSFLADQMQGGDTVTLLWSAQHRPHICCGNACEDVLFRCVSSSCKRLSQGNRHQVPVVHKV